MGASETGGLLVVVMLKNPSVMRKNSFASCDLTGLLKDNICMDNIMPYIQTRPCELSVCRGFSFT